MELLARAPSNPDILYAGLATLLPYANFEAQILERSLDGGQTWQDIPQVRWSANSLAVDAENPSTLYATQQNQLIRSLDGGATWQQFYDFGFQVAAPAPGRIYLLGWTAADNCPGGTSDDFARSLDGGQTWQRITVSCGIHNPERMFVNPNNPDQIFLSATTYGPVTYASIDGGLAWQVLELNGNPFAIADIAFDTAHPGRLFVATRDSALWTSANGGADWSACGEISATPIYPYLLQASQGNLYMLTQGWRDPSDQGWHIYRSQDQCASWWKALDGLPSFAQTFLADPRSPEKLVAATRGYGIYRSSNGGTTWQESNAGVSSPAKANTLALSASDPNVILAAGAWPRPAVYRSTDGGLSWSAQVRDAAAISLLIDPSDPKKAWMATDTGIFYSPDGETWNQTFKGPQNILDLAFSEADPGHPYAAGSEGFLPDQGYVFRWGLCQPDCSYSRWIPYPVSGSSLIRVIAVNPRDAQDILAGGYSASPTSTYSAIYRSRDGGRSWHEVLHKVLINQVRSLAIDPSNPSIRYVMMDQVGILRSQDGGETWQGWLPLPPASGQGSKLEIDDFGGVYLFSGYGYHRGVDDADWTALGGPIPGMFTGALRRGGTPFIVAARWDGLYRLNLPPIQKLWLPAVRN